MKYLLDTHAFLWSIIEDSKLSKEARRIIENSNNTIYVSAVTFWEISLKFGLGKIQLQGILPTELPKQALSAGFEVLPLSPEDCAGYHQLNLTFHKDPFDRMLIWQAIQQNLAIVSKDEKFIQYKTSGLKTIW